MKTLDLVFCQGDFRGDKGHQGNEYLTEIGRSMTPIGRPQSSALRLLFSLAS